MFKFKTAAISFRVAVIVSVTVISACDPKSSDPALEQTGTSGTREPPAEVAPAGEVRLRTVYVPAYSHLPQNEKPYKRQLSTLLSLRNVDSSATVTLTHVDYYDTSGHRVRRYLGSPRDLRPLETAEFIVDTRDDVGGSGANFLVYWQGPSDAHPLVTEAVMWGYLGQGYLSFTSRGVELDRRPDPKDFMLEKPVPASDLPENSTGED